MFSHTAITKNSHKALIIALALLFTPLAKISFVYFSSQSFAEEINQASAQKTAENLNDRGSDDSLEAATTNGMTAIMNLAALNIGGAIHYGYKAYGEYNNSKELDKLKAQTNDLKNSMASNGTQSAANNSSISAPRKTFSRLNSDFLYKGEAAAVAAEWEKRTGMRRDEFLNQVASASEAGLSLDDPNLMQKLEQRYFAFKAKINNQDFISALNKLEQMYPASERLGLFANGIQKIREYKASLAQANSNAKTDSPIKIAALEESKDKNLNANTPKEVTEEKSEPSRAPSSIANIAFKDKLGSFIGVESGKDAAFDELFKGAAAQDTENETIFQRISKKYRQIVASPNYSGSSRVAK